MKRWSKVFLVIMSTMIFFVAINDIAFADDLELHDASEEDVKKIHQDLDGILSIDKGLFYGDMLRTLGYWTVSFFDMVLRNLEKGVDNIITFGEFYETSAVGQLMESFQPFVMGLFLLTLIVVGIMLMLNKIEKRQDLLMNILIAVTMLVVIPAIFPLLNKVMVNGIDLVDGRGSLANDVLATNVADLEMYVDKDFKYGGEGGLPQPVHPNNPKKGTPDMSGANEIKSWYYFEPTEKIDLFDGEGFWKDEKWLSDIKKNHPKSYDVLAHRSDPSGRDKEMELRTLRKNMIPATTVGRESYYRYSVNWGTILITQLILSFALIITVVKMGRIVFDLGFHMIFSMFIAATDLTGGQRTKKMITEIVSSFAVFFVMVLILKLFIVYANWLVGLQAGGSLGTITYILMLLAGTWALLDAPDIVQRLLGIDAGLRSGYQALMGAWAVSKGAGAIPKLAGKGADMASSAMGAGAGAGAFTKGLVGRPAKSESKNIPSSGGGGNPPTSPSGGGGGGNPPIPPNDGGGNPPIPPNDGGGSLDGNDQLTRPNDSMPNDLDGDSTSIPSSDDQVRRPNDKNGMGSGKGSSAIPSNSKQGKNNTKSKGSIPLNDGKASRPINSSKMNANGEPIPSSDGQHTRGRPIDSSAMSAKGGSIPSSDGQNTIRRPNDSSSTGSGIGSSNSSSGSQDQSFINIDPKQVSNNPYYKPTFFGGGARGQRRAITQAKGYNSGTNLRRNLGNISAGIKSGSSTGRKAVGNLGVSNPLEKNIKDFNID